MIFVIINKSDKNKDKGIGRIQLIIVTNEILNRKKIFNSLGMKFEQSYSFKKLKLVSLLFSCLDLGQGSEKFKYIVSISLSNTSSSFLASIRTIFKLSSSENASFLAALNQAIADLRSDGTLTAISEKYFDIDITAEP